MTLWLMLDDILRLVDSQQVLEQQLVVEENFLGGLVQDVATPPPLCSQEGNCNPSEPKISLW